MGGWVPRGIINTLYLVAGLDSEPLGAGCNFNDNSFATRIEYPTKAEWMRRRSCLRVSNHPIERDLLNCRSAAETHQQAQATDEPDDSMRAYSVGPASSHWPRLLKIPR